MSHIPNEETAQVQLRRAIDHLFNLPEAQSAWQRAVDRENALYNCLSLLARQSGRELELDFADTKGEIPVSLKEWQQSQGFGLTLAAWLNQIQVRKGAVCTTNNLTGADTECSIHHLALEELFSKLHASDDLKADRVYVQHTGENDTLTLPLDQLAPSHPSFSLRPEWLSQPCLIYTVAHRETQGHLALDLLEQNAAQLGAPIIGRLRAVAAALQEKIDELASSQALRDLPLEATLQRIQALVAQAH